MDVGLDAGVSSGVGAVETGVGTGVNGTAGTSVVRLNASANARLARNVRTAMNLRVVNSDFESFIGSTTVVGCLLPFPAPSARRQPIIVVIQRYAPTAVRAAITPFSRLFSNVVNVPASFLVHELWNSG